ncbi:CHASE2 domain protein [Leptolyngbya sp. O-77]|nr:CHASE2 domain protein [Leptolyngbya sp. O-77]
MCRYKPNSGAYQRLDSSGYQTLLDYRARQNPARRVSLSQVLAQDISPEWVQDKIVLIGMTAPSGKDLFYTPFSAGEEVSHQMPGVMIHAQMVSQFLDAATGARSPFWFWAEWQECLWILGWATVSGAIAWSVRHPIALGLSSVGLLGLIAGAGFGLFLQQGWVPTVAPAIASMMALGTIVAYRAQQSHRQHPDGDDAAGAKHLPPKLPTRCGMPAIACWPQASCRVSGWSPQCCLPTSKGSAPFLSKCRRRRCWNG